MKQSITQEQLEELTAEARQRLDNWWDTNYNDKEIPGSVDRELWAPGYYYDPLLTIGQMIEFIKEKKLVDMHDHLKFNIFYKSAYVWYNEYQQIPGTNSHEATFNQRIVASFKSKDEENLCDALWDAVKDILEKSYSK